MDSRKRDEILSGGRGTEYAEAVMALLQDRRLDLYDQFKVAHQEALVRIQGAFNEIDYLIGMIESAPMALEVDRVYQTEFSEDDE
jgi:hypothetical protein